MRHVASIAFLDEDQYLIKSGLDRAERDGVLQYLASTYSRENDAVYDGISSPGPRIINFAHILKNDIFPLAGMLIDLLKLSSEAMNCAVEMEFAALLDAQNVFPAQFSILQVRPLVVQDELVKVELDDRLKDVAFCFSDRVLGNGVSQVIQDIVFVKPDAFDAAKSPQIAEEVDKLNSRLCETGVPYLLIGPGRWGSTDPWLGIPVKWSQISGVKVVVEASLPNMNVDPSQGSHFFQNMTSLAHRLFHRSPGPGPRIHRLALAAGAGRDRRDRFPEARSPAAARHGHDRWPQEPGGYFETRARGSLILCPDSPLFLSAICMGAGIYTASSFP